MAEKESKVNPAVIAIVLWAIGIIFQIGVIYATSSLKEYVDTQDKELRFEVKTLYERIDNKLDRLIEKEGKENANH